MNVDIRDAAALRALSASEVMSYLRSHGWHEDDSTERASIWTQHKAGSGYFEAAVPLSTDSADYALRMGEVLRTLHEFENRSQMEVYSDLLTTLADVIRVRIDDPDFKNGTLPVDANVQIAQKTRDLLMAAACSTTEHRPVWHSRKPSEAIDQVRKTRIGQSERGSYVVTIVCSVPPRLEAPNDGQLFERSEPFSRRMTQGLATSLDAINRAAARAAASGELASFEESVSKGVSANLCEAVAGFWANEESDRKVDFQFSWSGARPVAQNTPSMVRFSYDRIPLILEASRLMRERRPVEDFELEGAVISLHSEDVATSGKISVLGHIDGHLRRVHVELSEPDYSLAIHAHQNQSVFRCTGTLVREGRSFALQHPHSVDVLSSDAS